MIVLIVIGLLLMGVACLLVVTSPVVDALNGDGEAFLTAGVCFALLGAAVALIGMAIWLFVEVL
jgi:hypothetical protein